jgi:broad specificity phosphatase PhoE
VVRRAASVGDVSAPLSLLLVRHGQSTWNAAGRWQGQADPPLSDLGRWQAAIAADRLGAFDAIVASSLQRASETAHIIAELLGVGPVLVDPDLVERDAGPWSGLTRAEIDARWPGHLAEGRRPEGYEPDEPLVARACAALDRIATMVSGGDALVVTHGGVIYALEGMLGGAFDRIGNLGGRWFHRDPGGRLRLGERVVLVDPDTTTVPDIL